MKPIFSHILVAVTGSDASILAAKQAIVMAKAYKCSLTAVYVVDTATLKQLTLSKIFIQEESLDYQKNLQADGVRYLAYVEELANAKGITVNTEMRQGAVYTEILHAADDHEADLIILGGWEHNRNPRDIFSQTHREIMINAKCSVLFTKEPQIDQIYKHA